MKNFTIIIKRKKKRTNVVEMNLINDISRK